MEKNNYEKLEALYHTFGENEELLNTFYANDYPVPFKSLKVYPVQVDLYFYFQLFSQCLVEPHRTSGDIKAISMSYLQFICYLALEKGRQELLVFLTELLSIVFQEPTTIKNESGEQVSNIEVDLDKFEVRVGGESISAEEFDRLRKIILEQNGVEVPDESLNPELVKAYNELEEFKRKQAHMKMCNFEEQINIVVAQTSYRRDEILRMTIRSFTRLFERLLLITDYEIKSLLSPYMSEKDVKKITHYLSDTRKTLKERIEGETTDEKQLRNLVEGKQG